MVRLSVPAQHASMRLLRELVNGLAAHYTDRPVAPSPQRLDAWALAVHEAATNVVKHGYGGGSDAPITLSILPADDRVVFTLKDHGEPNPRWPWSPPDRPAFNDGGYGLRIIHTVMDEVTYHRDASGKNVLTMTARLDHPAG